MPRVYDLARELGTDSRAILDRLRSHGFTWYRSASEQLDPAALAFLRGQPPPRPPRGLQLDDDDEHGRHEDITAAAAAARHRVSAATVRQWAARGYITPTGKRGRAVLYDAHDVSRAAAERRDAVSEQRRPVPRVRIQSRDLDAAVSTRDAATIAGVTPATIRTWAARGHLAPVTEPGKRPQLYRVQDVLKAARRR